MKKFYSLLSITFIFLFIANTAYPDTFKHPNNHLSPLSIFKYEIIPEKLEVISLHSGNNTFGGTFKYKGSHFPLSFEYSISHSIYYEIIENGNYNFISENLLDLFSEYPKTGRINATEKYTVNISSSGKNTGTLIFEIDDLDESIHIKNISIKNERKGFGSAAYALLRFFLLSAGYENYYISAEFNMLDLPNAEISLKILTRAFDIKNSPSSVIFGTMKHISGKLLSTPVIFKMLSLSVPGKRINNSILHKSS